MRILLISLWKPRKGGVVTHVSNLVKNSENDFLVLTYDNDTNPEVLGARYIDLPVLRALTFTVSGFFKAKNADFDVIHAHYAVPQGLLGVLLKKSSKKPLVVTLHGSDITILAKNWVTRPLVKYVLKNADSVITVSEFLRNEVLKLGINATKVTTIYAGFSGTGRDSALLSERKTITFIGALVKQKGVDILLKAFKSVKEVFPESQLLIVGDGKERKNLERLVEDLGLCDVRFRGFDVDLENIFKETSVLTQPSREEGFGLALLEAMNYCIPVVASRVGGMKEIIENGYNGILVKKEDPEELSKAIIEVLKDEELRVKMIKNGKESIKRFSWEKMADEIDGFYKELAG
ncbi:MAG: glycosyltransferase family 4 protein [Candidatus Hydrothermarchaeales archaeon]